MTAICWIFENRFSYEDVIKMESLAGAINVIKPNSHIDKMLLKHVI